MDETYVTHFDGVSLQEEERNRMREHVFGEIDKDKDYLISLEEFIHGTQGEEYEKDEGWKTVDDEEVSQGFFFVVRITISK